jgi:hypothetical protein
MVWEVSNMAEKNLEDQSTNVTEPVYPLPNLQVVFADGVLNFSNSKETTKFYLFRFDPSLNGVGPSHLQPACQVVMPLTSFLGTAAFLSGAIESLIRQGLLTQDQWKQELDKQKGHFANG